MAKILPEMEVESLTLQKLRYGVRQAFGEQILAEVDMESYRDHMFDRMIYDLRCEILAEKLAEKETKVSFERTVYFAYPETWWQHLKDDWNTWFIPSRLRDLLGTRIGLMLVRQVRFKTVTKTVGETKRVKVEQFAGFPAASIRTPEKFRGPILVRKEQLHVPE